jgi:hypothetical protein
VFFIIKLVSSCLMRFVADVAEEVASIQQFESLISYTLHDTAMCRIESRYTKSRA